MPETNQGREPAKAGDGTVGVYDIPAAKWTRRAAVDAREMVAHGTGCFSGPDVEMIGPAGRITVCQTEVEKKEADGYTVVDKSAVPVRTFAKVVKHDEDDDKRKKKEEPPASYNFSRHTVADLQQFATQANINDAGAMHKSELCEALDESGWRPPQAK